MTARTFSGRTLLPILGISILIIANGPIESVAAEPLCRGKRATIVGTDGADSLRGTSENDVIVAGGGADKIVLPPTTAFGAGERDIVCGGTGNDTINSPVGNGSNAGRPQVNLIDGESGIDRVVYEDATQPINAHLGIYGGRGEAARIGPPVAEDRLYSIENLTGSRGDDVLLGGPRRNVIDGGGGYDRFVWHPTDTGDDTFDGGDDGGWLDFSRATGPVRVDLLAESAFHVVDAGTGFDVAVGIDDVTGSFFSDVLLGNNKPNVISNVLSSNVDKITGDGDFIEGRGGDDVLSGSSGLVTIEGGDDNDSMSAAGFEAISVTGGPGNDRFSTSIAPPSGITYLGKGTFHMGAGDDIVHGTVMDDEMFGEDGDDILNGGFGNDLLDGGTHMGGDAGDGGPGSDTCVDIEGDTSCASGSSPDTSTGPTAVPGPEADLQIAMDRVGDGRYRVTMTNLGPDAIEQANMYMFFGGPITDLQMDGPGDIPFQCIWGPTTPAQDGDAATCMYGAHFSEGNDLLPGQEVEVIVEITGEFLKPKVASAAAVGVAGARDATWTNNVLVMGHTSVSTTLSGKVTDGDLAQDGHANRLDGVQVELYQAGALVEGPIATTNGDYSFSGLTAGRYRLRVTLVDAQRTPSVFEVRHGANGPNAVWLESNVEVKEGRNTFDIAFSEHQNPVAVDPSVPARRHDILDDMAEIFFRTEQFVEWAEFTLIADLGSAESPLPVEMMTFSDLAGPDGAYYCHTAGGAQCLAPTSVHISNGDSLTYSRNHLHDEGPENIEWHEFGHHLFEVNIGDICAEANHNGYANPSTCDAVSEGVAEFLPMVAWGDITGTPDSHYANFDDLEPGRWKAWSAQVVGGATYQREELAFDSLMWDLLDANPDQDVTQVVGANDAHVNVTYTDNVSIPLDVLWRIFDSGVTTVRDLRLRLSTDQAVPAALKTVNVDLDADGTADVAPLDIPFLMHGFYPVPATEMGPTHNHYDVNVADDPEFDSSFTGTDRNRAVGRTDSLFNGTPRRPRFELPEIPSANLRITLQDANGNPVRNGSVVITTRHPMLTTDREVFLDDSTDNVYLELPPYFGGLLPLGDPLPPCNESLTYPVEIEVVGEFVRATSKKTVTFDNCEYAHAVDASEGDFAIQDVFTIPRQRSDLLVSAARSTGMIGIKGSLLPSSPGAKIQLRLQKKRGRAWRTVGRTSARLGPAIDRDGSGLVESLYAKSISRRGSGKCRVAATWQGDALSFPDTARTKTFSC